jgi:predicted DNA-binding transcriptional regulator YafY
MLDDARTIARKIATSFAQAQASRILAMHRRILVGAQASDQVLSSYRAPPGAVTQPLLDASVNRRVAVIRYQDQHATVTEREIELQYLYYNLPVWYALVWDRLRDNVRFFRIDRIKRLQLLREQFRLRRDDQFLTAGEPDAKAL